MDARANEILQRTQQVYQSCKSYRDKGTARKNVYSNLDFVELTTFETTFSKSASFKFGWDRVTNSEFLGNIFMHNNSVEYIGTKLITVSDNETEVHTEPTQELLSNSLCLADLISYVPEFLLIDFPPNRFKHFAKLIGITLTKAGPCYMISLQEDENKTIWIDTDNYLIRKIRQFTKHDRPAAKDLGALQNLWSGNEFVQDTDIGGELLSFGALISIEEVYYNEIQIETSNV